jgi:hypothetical protein
MTDTKLGPWTADRKFINRRSITAPTFVVSVNIEEFIVDTYPEHKKPTYFTSLQEAVAYADQWLLTYTPEKTAEQKLSDALAEIELLKQELRVALRQDAHRTTVPKLDFYKTEAVGSITIKPDTESKYLRDKEDYPF